jgi:alanyl-tRNA synthetase
MRTSSQVREAFLAYFQKNGHTRVPSSALVPHNDPTLLFTNAGMNQFKDVFTGREKRDYKRACSSQKCVRAGGKHNDLENVGRTARHHTFFEMLGNFSFGDYFKEDAIRFAWELLTKDLGIPAARLQVTVFGGDSAMKLPADDEARALWKKIAGLPDDRILGLGAKDNFWQMGDTGPCGPCSEIHFHQGDDLPCPERECKGPACDCDRWLEIWNLVFMQFERDSAGNLSKLPAPSVDTGMGLERLCAVLQGKRSNYETDLFTPIIGEIEKIAKKKLDHADFSGANASIRAIADHARATAFLMADGVMPEKTGREYVLRRIMRRAIYHGWLLGIGEPFFQRVVDVVIGHMGEVYPELRERRATILEMTQIEEKKFRQTLDRGIKLIEENTIWKSVSPKIMPGKFAFNLKSTYGFPIDLLQVIGEQRGFSVDMEEYAEEEQIDRERSSFAGSGEEGIDDVWKKVRGEVGPTKFLGYTTTEFEGTVLHVEQRGNQVSFVTDRTPFYGEQGGQIGDTGTASAPGVEVRITDTKKPGGDLTVHMGELVRGSISKGDKLQLVVDFDRRQAIRKNHSATHLVHWALRQVLGEHVAQKGSVVAPDRLRFDFSHTKPMTDEERARVEALVNERVWRNEPVGTDELSLDDARKTGAIAFFGEKYGDKVRVVQMTESKEFCGGTHVARTGDIGLFKITEEMGIAQGVRRIVAVTGPGALDYVQRLESTVGAIAERVKAGGADVVEKVDKLREETRTLQKKIEELQRKLASGGSRDLLSDARDVGGVKLLATKTDLADPKALRDVGDKLRDKMGSGVLVLAGVADGKVALLAMVTKDLAERFHAGKIIGEIAPLVGGRGGGRPDMAQAGGSNADGVDAALAKVAEIVAR